MIFRASLIHGPIDVASARNLRPASTTLGGYASFEGIIREENHQKAVRGIDYEAYEILAQSELENILREAVTEFELGFAEVIHRIGWVSAGDVAVLVQTMARHRHPAISGCEYVIDQLKKRVPIWKKEIYQDGTYHWPTCNH